MEKNIVETSPALSLSKTTSREGREARLQYIESLGISSEIFSTATFTDEEVRSNIENYIGTISIPLGLVGPLLKQKPTGPQTLHSAIATTEGALVASINRGAKAISLSGGFKAHVVKQVMVRSPCFSFKTLTDALVFQTFVEARFEVISELCKKYSKHAQLKAIRPTLMGKEIHLAFEYQTGNAAGQNMTTTCTWHACLELEAQFNLENPLHPITEFLLDGNSSSDKKANFASLQTGRGVCVVAEVYLQEDVINKVLKTDSQTIIRWYNRLLAINSLQGMMGAQMNISNVIAGIFTATGQDLACIHESSVGALNIEKTPEGLYVSIRLPRLVIGTVGGGTGLATAKKVRELSSIDGVESFAELIAGFCLALEISTGSAMVNGQFASAHERLGRNRPIQSLKPQDWVKLIHEQAPRLSALGMMAMKPLPQLNGVFTHLAQENSSKPLGFFAIQTQKPARVILKNKAQDRDLLIAMNRLMSLIDPALARSFLMFQDQCDYQLSHEREIQVYQALDAAKFSAMPQYLGSVQHAPSETNALFLENFNPEQMKIMNSEMDPSAWNSDLLIELTVNLRKAQCILNQAQLSTISPPQLDALVKFCKSAYKTLQDEDAISPELKQVIDKSFEWIQLEAVADLKSVVHNDFNPKNVAVTQDFQFKIYDWELASLQYPHRDIIEFAAYLDTPQVASGYMAMRHTLHEILRQEGKVWNEVQVESAQKQAFAYFVLSRVIFLKLYGLLKEVSYLDRAEANLSVLMKLLDTTQHSH